MCQMWVVFVLRVNPRTCEGHYVNFFLFFFIYFLKLLHPDDFAAHLASNCNSYPEKKALGRASDKYKCPLLIRARPGEGINSWQDVCLIYLQRNKYDSWDFEMHALVTFRTTWHVLLIIVNTFPFLIILFTRTWHVKGLVSVFNSRQMFLLVIIR